MAFCGKCGSRLEEGVKFCPACGASTELSPQGPGIPAYHPPVVPGAPVQSDIRDVQENKVMAILAYISILVLIPMFAARESPFARYHANQGLVLFIVEVIYSVIFSVLGWIVLTFFWQVAFFLWIWGAVSIVFVIFAVIGVINANGGEMKPLPLIGGIRLIG